jgi:hypothetical protein
VDRGAFHKKTSTPDTVLRDGTLLILLFLTKNKFVALKHDRACYVVTEVFKRKYVDCDGTVAPLAPLEIEALALDHTKLLADMQNIIKVG